MFFHPDPSDRDGLLAFAYMNRREDELKEIQGVVGKELSKHHRKKKLKDGKRGQENTYIDERNRQDYFRPSQALFRDYCQEIVERYGLGNIVEESVAHSISFDSPTSLFTVQSSKGAKRVRIVVLAIGSGQEPRIPPGSPFHNLQNSLNVQHIFEHSGPERMLPASLLSDGHPKTLAIVGGGLTSAQIAQVAATQNVSRIHLILRGPLRTKHFDVDLCWLAKFKNESMSRFWKADEDSERGEMMKQARGGGSVNPEYRDVIRDLQKKEVLKLWEWTDVQDAKLNEGDKEWSLQLSSAGETSEIKVNAVIYATGEMASIGSVDAMRPILEDHPVEIVGGMPCLISELMWNEAVPLFVTGKLGGLRLGPAAGSLEGARLGAEFIAGKIASISSAWQHVKEREETSPEEIDMGQLGLGRANQFEILGDQAEEEGGIRSML